MSDRVVSYLRTFVPIWWGALVTWLLAQFTGLAGFLDWFGVDLEAPAAAGVATSVVIALWYAAWRWAEPRLPDWLTRLTLGSAKAPTYDGPRAAGGVIPAGSSRYVVGERGPETFIPRPPAE